MAVKIEFQTNAQQTVKDLRGVESKLENIKKQAVLKQGLDKMNDTLRATGLDKIAGIGELAGEMGTKLQSITKLLNPWAVGIALAIGACKAIHAQAQRMIDSGQPAAKEQEQATARLRAQGAAKGILDPAAVAEKLAIMAENGVASVESLTSTFTRLLPTFQGDEQAALQWIARLADVQAATGTSAESLASLIEIVEDKGELDEKTAKTLQKNGIPIYRELAKVYGVDVAAVQAMSKAHKIGVKELKQALMQATEMYKGTAADLSSTTEGARASMESAQARMYKASADSYNAVMRDFYTRQQAIFDAMATDEEWNNRQKIIGETMGKLDALFSQLGSNFVLNLDSLMGKVAEFTDWLSGSAGAATAAGRDTATKRDNLRRVRAGMGAMDYQTASSTRGKIGEELYNAEQALTQLEQELANSPATMTSKNNALKDAIKESQAYIEELKAAYDDFAKHAQEVGAAEVRAEHAREQAAKDAQRATESAAAKEEQKSLVMGGDDRAKIASLYGFNSEDELIKDYEATKKLIMQGFIPTESELKTWKELEKAYSKILELRKKEDEEIQSILDGQEKRARDEAQAAIDRAYNTEEERRKLNHSDDYEKAYQHFMQIYEKIADLDLTKDEQDKALDKAFFDLMKSTRQNAIKGTDSTLSVGGQSVSLKDFKFTDWNIDEKQLKTLEDIRQAELDAAQTWNRIESKLPSPATAL